MPSVIPCSLSSLISRIHSYLFSGWRRTVSSKFFDTQVSSFSTEELVLPHHAHFVLSRHRSNQHSLLLSSYLCRIGRSKTLPAAPVDTVPGHLSSHSALSRYGIFAALALCRLSLSIRFLFQALGSCPASKAPWSSTMPPSLGRGPVKTTTTTRSRSIELKL